MLKNIYFNLASKDNSNAPGIRPSTNKFQRFNVVVPLFKMGKIYFPKDKKLHPALIEMLEEIRLVSYGGFKSKHDDGLDTISMLAAMNVFLPSEEAPMQYSEQSGIFEIAMATEDVSVFSTYTV